MEQIGLLTSICLLCILKPCYVLDLPRLEGGQTGQILDFNCSTSQEPFGNTVEIVTNGQSIFTLAHFNSTCIRKHVVCKPNDCSCSSNWFEWKMAIQKPTTILKVQCLMRLKANNRTTVKATIAFNGSYFWDYSEYITFTTKTINFSRTAIDDLYTIDTHDNYYIYILAAFGSLLMSIISVAVCYKILAQSFPQYRTEPRLEGTRDGIPLRIRTKIV